ncbi:MAG: flippase-like domain-containing protein [Alphaproteobacteria bacterium]|nr:flippase-like domain-containing protein [Alphaproteobacteria bacterium]
MRAVVSLVLIALMLWAYDWRQIIGKLTLLTPTFVLFAWAYYAICQWLSAYRWRVLLRAKGVDVPTVRLFVFYMVGMFANNFMPGGLGGDAVKAYSLYRQGESGNVAVASVFVERFCGILALSVLGAVASVAMLVAGRPPLTPLLVLGFVVLLAAAAAMVWSTRLARLLRWLLAVLAPRLIRDRAARLVDTVHSYRHDWHVLLHALAISVLLQGMIALFYSLVGLALAVPVPILYFLLFLPMVTMITLLPISLGGLGVREIAMVYLFATVGVSSEDMLSISLTAHILNTALSLSGGIMLLASRFSWVSQGKNLSRLERKLRS